jgi:Uma2 family endonuclease
MADHAGSSGDDDVTDAGSGVKLTYDDFLLFPDDGKRHEFYSPYDVVFSNFDIVEPDLTYLSRERAAQVLTPLHAKGVPELVVEIGSPATRKRDETIKRRLYERAGVTEYWVVDPDLDVIRVYRRGGDRFDRPIELSSEAGDILRSPLLPGLELTLAAIFKE